MKYELVWMQHDISLRPSVAFQVRLTLSPFTGSDFILSSAPGVTDWEEKEAAGSSDSEEESEASQNQNWQPGQDPL